MNTSHSIGGHGDSQGRGAAFTPATGQGPVSASAGLAAVTAFDQLAAELATLHGAKTPPVSPASFPGVAASSISTSTSASAPAFAAVPASALTGTSGRSPYPRVVRLDLKPEAFKPPHELDPEAVDRLGWEELRGQALAPPIPEQRGPDFFWDDQGQAVPIQPVTEAKYQLLPCDREKELRILIESPPCAGWIHFKIADPTKGKMELRKVVRSDGKVLKAPKEVWIAYEPELADEAAGRLIHILDEGGVGSYVLQFWAPRLAGLANRREAAAVDVQDEAETLTEPRDSEISAAYAVGRGGLAKGWPRRGGRRLGALRS